MSKFPVIQQHDAMDCGPTCLAMICQYYGKHFNVEHLHDLCFISNEGVSLYGISQAAEQIGFHTIGTQISFSDLIDEMPLPCILYWNQIHFVVLYKIKRRHNGYQFYIANPAGGVCLKFNELDFCKCWLNAIDPGGDKNGIALSLQPTPKFADVKEDLEQKQQKKILKFLFSYLTPYKRTFLFLLFALIGGAAIQLVLPFLMQAIVDVGIKGKDINLILLILLGQLALETGNAIVGFIRSWLLLKVGMKVNISLISDYLTKLMKLPIFFLILS